MTFHELDDIYALQCGFCLKDEKCDKKCIEFELILVMTHDREHLEMIFTDIALLIVRYTNI